MTMYLSPLVDVNEIDLSTTIPAVATSIGVIILRDTWKGPELKVQLVNSIDELIDTFGRPEEALSVSANGFSKRGQSYEDLLSAAGFLQFGQNLYCTRVLAPSATFAGCYGTVEELGGSNSSSSTSNSSSSSCPFGPPTWQTYFDNTIWEDLEGGATWNSELEQWDSVTFAYPGVGLAPLTEPSPWASGFRPSKIRVTWTPDIPLTMELRSFDFPTNELLSTNVSAGEYGTVTPSGMGTFDIEWTSNDLTLLTFTNYADSTSFSVTNIEFLVCGSLSSSSLSSSSSESSVLPA